MKILLVNAAAVSHTEVDALQDWICRAAPRVQQVTRVNLDSKNIYPCSACMSCQIKSPGICIRRDDMQDLLPAYINSDLVIFVTPLFCGGYSSELKKFIDRMCPVLTACFEKRNGETWHIPRYDKRPVSIGIGLRDNPGAPDTIFRQLFSRNMKQLNISQYSCQTLIQGLNPNQLEMTFHQIFNQAGIWL
ncbi:MAG: flavodoxin family protein [Anaerolineales bacterium]|nr:flavodoxin family protein [Anaerolineales bacterium]